MIRIRECTDREECRQIWKRVWPEKNIFDLWDVRSCFDRSFDRLPVFLVAEQDNRLQGLLPLSWIDEEQYYAVFPGETWQGKTWLEQNRIPAVSSQVREELLASIPGPAHLRYLSPESVLIDGHTAEADETGYIFVPGHLDHSFNSYMQQFSKKFRKNCERETSRFEASGVMFRHDDLSDVRHLFRMNIDGFGELSYFSDPRFLSSFEQLVEWLFNNGLLRITTVIIGGVIAAVDIGAVLGRNYTVLAGGTNPEFQGVAKLINFHHLEISCAERFEIVDFLCGDFGWKERFHLTPRPLYQITVGSGRRSESKVHAFSTVRSKDMTAV